MRVFVVLGLAGILAGCATQTSRPDGPRPFDDGARGHRHGGPERDGLERDGRNRVGPGQDGPGHAKPEHGRGQLFISPMGEPFRASQHPGAAQELWFAGADSDGDGRITEAEFQRDATRFFAVLDRSKDGEIDPDDIAHYENVLVPEIRVASSGRGPASGGRSPGGAGRRGPGRGGSGGGGGSGRGAGGGSGGGSGGGGQGMHLGGDGDARKSGAAVRERQGAARFGFFDLPEPVVAADANLNRGIDPREFAKAASVRFAALDRNHDGALTRGELPKAGAETWRNGSDEPAAPPEERPERESPDR